MFFLLPIVGNSFRPKEFRQCFAELEIGDPLQLERDPENPHDKNAIRVLDGEGTWLGFVPREDAKSMAITLDNGTHTSKAIVSGVHINAKGRPEVMMEIELIERT